MIKIKNIEEIRERLNSQKDYKMRVKLIFLNLMSSKDMELGEGRRICGIAVPYGYYGSGVK